MRCRRGAREFFDFSYCWVSCANFVENEIATVGTIFIPKLANYDENLPKFTYFKDDG